MDKKEFLTKMFNEVQMRDGAKFDIYTLWELIRQGEFIIESDKVRFKFYDQFYTRLNNGEKFDEEKVFNLSYFLREEAGEV